MASDQHPDLAILGNTPLSPLSASPCYRQAMRMLYEAVVAHQAVTNTMVERGADIEDWLKNLTASGERRMLVETYEQLRLEIERRRAEASPALKFLLAHPHHFD